MYQVERHDAVGANRGRSLAGARGRISATVWFLGLTSLMTDVSSEMITAILPLYLVAHLGLTPLAFGAIDGLQQGLSAVVRWAGGFAGDRLRRHKQVAALGYALSAAVKPAWIVSGATWPVISLLVGIDRFGKGIRTAPRDALISLSTPSSALGYAFGVHRALDATGAMIGPVVAFAILTMHPARFDMVFAFSFAAAMIGLGILLLFVQNPTTQAKEPHAEADRGPSFSEAFLPLRESWFRTIVIAGSALAVVTVSDAFIYLTLQRQFQFDVNLLPLMYVVTSFVYLMLAVPFGYLADRHGRPLVFLAGHVVLLFVYAALLGPVIGGMRFWIAPMLLGAYYAATDGVLPAMASARLDARVRGSGLALLGTATSLSRLLASLMFGWCWMNYGYRQATAAFGTTLAIVIIAAAYPLARIVRAPSS
jgi:MFS family permease